MSGAVREYMILYKNTGNVKL